MAAVALPRVLSNHLVLQQNMAAPIWGTAAPGEQITVSFQGQKKTATADARGAWMVRLDPLKASAEPSALIVSGSNTITLSDILVGEVWVGSGQSNMDTDVPDYTPDDAPLREAASVEHPQVRLLRSDYGDGWQTTTPESVRRFSAQLFYFGATLQKELNVPVGLMEGAVRGSPSREWLPQEAYDHDPAIKAAMEDSDKYQYVPQHKDFEQKLVEWQKQVAALPPGTPKDQQPARPWEPSPAGAPGGKTGALFETHIKPFLPYGIRGVLWDQGEGGAINGVDQHVVIASLIRSWRKDWQEGDFAFLYVQKPSGGGPALDPGNPVNKGADTLTNPPMDPPQRYWDGSARFDYVRIMQENSKTFMVPTTDLDTGVHPKNKSGYAQADVRVALGAVYGRPVEFSGPLYKSCESVGGKMRLTFTHVGKGLIFAKDKPQGFCLAGEDKRFCWADVVIDGQTLLLSSPQVPRPVAARYAWAWDVRWANFFNRDGLPAPMFRTDDWW